MDWKPVVDIVVTAVFLLGIGLALWRELEAAKRAEAPLGEAGEVAARAE